MSIIQQFYVSHYIGFKTYFIKKQVRLVYNTLQYLSRFDFFFQLFQSCDGELKKGNSFRNKKKNTINKFINNIILYLYIKKDTLLLLCHKFDALAPINNKQKTQSYCILKGLTHLVYPLEEGALHNCLCWTSLLHSAFLDTAHKLKTERGGTIKQKCDFLLKHFLFCKDRYTYKK